MKKLLSLLVLGTLAGLIYAATLNDVQTLVNKKQYKEAITACNEILAQKPGNINALRWLAYAYYLSGDYDGVININNDIKDAEIANMKGLAFLGKNDTVQAEKEFSNAIIYDKNLISPYKNKAKIYIDNKDFANAKSYLVMANNLDPKNQDVLNDLGFVNIQLGEYDNAIANLTKAKQLKANNENVLLNLGSAYVSKKDYNNALKEYTALYKINPKNIEAVNGLATVNAALNNIDESIKYYNILLKTNNTYEANYNIGILYRKKNDFKNAVVHLNKAIELNPNDENALVELAWCQFKSNDTKSAIETLNKILAVNPDNVVANAYLGVINSNSNNLQEAYSNWSKCVLLAQKNPNYKVNLGNTCIGLEKYDEAINAFKNAITINPNIVNAYLGLGIAQLSKALGEEKVNTALVNEALKNFKTVVEKEPKNGTAWTNMGVCYQKTNKYNDAMNAYKKALSINPNNSEAKANMDELSRVMK